jgi:soluble lytic murein transglycosylase-like protein
MFFMGTQMRHQMTNNMAGKARKKNWLSLSFVVAMACHILAGVAVHADQVRLKDGRTFNADEVWELGNDIWYRQGKVINSIDKNTIARILRGTPEQVEAQLSAEAAALNASKLRMMPAAYVGGIPGTISAMRKDAVRKAEIKRADKIASNRAEMAELAKKDPEAAAAKQKISRIILKGGIKIDADTVWEEPSRIGYRLGKIQTFVDREAVERIQRDIVEDEPLPDVKLPNLKFSTGNRSLDALIAQNAVKYDLNPLLIYCLMRQESGFNVRAVSRVGARGLMQLMPDTARRFGVKNIHDPIENLDAGTRYLKFLLNLFNDNVNLALAGYNAGENAVIRYGYQIPPYRETQHYVYAINAAYRRAVAQGQEPTQEDLNVIAPKTASKATGQQVQVFAPNQ